MTSKHTSKKLSNENILILGKGYIGNSLYKELKHKFSVTIVSSAEVNYHDRSALSLYLLNNNIDIVVNCSGFTGRPNIDEAEEKKELCWELNVMSPIRINQVCNRLDLKYIHISSGCIYDGYQQEWTELDKPNYGLFSNESSFYSKSKHAFEIMSKDLRSVILRIRMPIGKDRESRNYLTKILKYDKLIDYVNSKTYIPDLCGVMENIILSANIDWWKSQKILNVVNHEPLYTSEVTSILRKNEMFNPNWEFVKIEDIDIKAGRSNCVLDSYQVNRIYPMRSETQALEDIFNV